MNKRKQTESSSCCSQVLNPEFPSHHSSSENPNLKKMKTSMTVTSKSSFNDLGAGISVQFFHVQLNGAPFYDFFHKDDQVPSKKKQIRFDFSQSSSLSYSTQNSESSETATEAAVPLQMWRGDLEWKVRKVLTASDCNAQHRLLIRKADMEGYIIPGLDESRRVLINTPDGLRVKVFDIDVGVELELTLKKWPSSQGYGLMNNWKRDFVARRGLVPGDEVAICWDESNRKLLFSLLTKST